MASAYGIVHQYGEPDALFNPQLAAQALQFKQDKFDSNVVKVEQTLQQLGLSMSMMVREEDQEYMYEKVNGLIQSIPSLKDTDFSSNQSTRNILSRVNEALDERVITQLANSKKIRDFQGQIQALQESNRELYSDINYQDALKRAGYEEYMSGQTQNIGALSYSNYVDVQDKLLDGIKKAQERIGEQEIDFTDADGITKRRKVSNMTISEWMTYMPNLVTPDMQRQLQINARAMYGWDNSVAQAQAAQQKQAIEAEYDKKINTYQTLLDNKNLSPAQQDNFRKEIKRYQNLKARDAGAINPEKATAESLGYVQLYSKLIRDNAALVGADPSLTFLDPKKFGGLNTPYNVQQWHESIGISGSSPFGIGSEALKKVDSGTFDKQRQDAKDKVDNWVNLGMNKAKENPDFDFDATVEAYKNTMSEQDAKTQAVFDYYKKNNKPEEVVAGNALMRVYKEQNDIAEQAHATFVTNEVFKNPKVYDAVIEKGAFDRQKLVIDGQEIASKDYLEQQGIKTKADYDKFIDDKERSGEFVSQILGDVFLNEVNQNFFGGKTNLGSILKKGGGNIANISKSTLHNFDRFARSVGLDGIEFTDTFKVSEVSKTTTGEFFMHAVGLSPFADVTERELTPKEVRELAKEFKFVSDIKVELREDADPRIVEAINKRLKYVTEEDSTTVVQQIMNTPRDVGRAIFGGDSNFYDDYSVRDLLSFDSNEYKEGYNKAIQKGLVTVTTSRKVTVKSAPTEKERKIGHTELENVVADPLAKGNLNYDPKRPTTIYRSPIDPNQIVIEQTAGKEFVDDKKEGMQSVSTRMIKQIEISQFAQLAPTLYDSIELGEEAGKLKLNQRLNEETTNIGYLDSADDKSLQAHLRVFPNPQIVAQANSSDAKALLKSEFRPLFENQPMLSVLADEAIDNSHKFKVKMVQDDDGEYSARVMVNASTNPNQPDFQSLTNVPLGADEIDQAIKVFDVAPQVFLTQALQKVFELYRREGADSIENNRQTNLLLEALFQNQ